VLTVGSLNGRVSHSLRSISLLLSPAEIAVRTIKNGSKGDSKGPYNQT
jgi:hypothetical protein